MLYDRKELSELFFMKHIHDDNDSKYIKYDEKILVNTLSPYMFENDFMNEWINKMQPLASISMDQMNLMKNFKNYMVDKWEWRQK